MDISAPWIIAALVLAGVIVFILHATKGVLRDYEHLEGALADLLNRGLDNGTLFIKHKNSHRFVQFRKYIRSRINYGIELHFPNAAWSRNYFQRLQDYCETEGLTTTRIVGDDENHMEFLCVDFKCDIERAHAVLGYILHQIFNLPAWEKYYVRLWNARPY